MCVALGLGVFPRMRWSKVGQGRVRQTRAGIGVRRVRVSLCNGGCFGLSCSIELFDMNIIDVELQFCLSLSLGFGVHGYEYRG
jgi:hypothetical protein